MLKLAAKLEYQNLRLSRVIHDIRAGRIDTTNIVLITFSIISGISEAVINYGRKGLSGDKIITLETDTITSTKLDNNS